MVPFTSSVRGGSRGIGLLWFGQGNQAGFAAFLQPVTFPANVDRSRMVQQAVENGGGDDRVAEDRTPLAAA